MAGAGTGVLASSFATPGSTPSVGAELKSSCATCWVLNDDIYGTLFSTCLGLGLTVLRNLDARLIQAQGQSRKVLLEDLIRQKPDLLLGVLKAPATQVGTKMERQCCETLFALCGEQLRSKQSILFVGPRTNRYMDSPGIKTSVATWTFAPFIRQLVLFGRPHR